MSCVLMNMSLFLVIFLGENEIKHFPLEIHEFFKLFFLLKYTNRAGNFRWEIQAIVLENILREIKETVSGNNTILFLVRYFP